MPVTRIDVRCLATRFLFAVSLLAAGGVHAESLDCDAPAGAPEAMICTSPSLTDLEARVTQAYRRLLAAAGPAWENRLHRSQQEWVRMRNTAVTSQMAPHVAAETLQLSMQSRLTALQGALVSRRGVRLLRIDRAVVQQVDRELQSYAGDRSHVVQTSILFYVLDGIPGAAAFNAFIDKHYPMLSDPARAADSESDLAADLNFVSPELISASISTSSFFFGAAHPMVRLEQLNYMLAAGRRLRASDLFASHDYEQILVGRMTDAFAQSGLDPLAATPQEIRVQLLDPANWTLSGRGLIVVIPPDTLFSHAEGSPDMPLIPWSAFHDCLTPWAQRVFAERA